MHGHGRLVVALVLATAVAILEFWGGAASHSIALTTDAVHVCMDVFALGVALIAAIGATRPANRRKTFGYGRVEILGALFNGTLLLGATIIIVYEAVMRFGHPVEPHGTIMTIVAAIGLAVNLLIAFTLTRGHLHGHDHDRGHGQGLDSDLNVRAALYHVVGDALGALAVIVGGIIIAITHQAWIDPLLSLFVAAIIVVGVVHVLREAADVVLESTPPGIDSGDVERKMLSIETVVAVHDLHVWTIGSGSHALSAHVLLDDRRLSEAANVLRDLRSTLNAQYGITHVTLQLECETCDPGEVMICGVADN